MSTWLRVFARYRVPFLCAMLRYAGWFRKKSASLSIASPSGFSALMSACERFTMPMKPSLSGYTRPVRMSSAFVPVATMPEWLQWIAENQPITPIIETLRGLLMGTPLDDSPAWALGWCALILVAGVVWIALLFPRRRARR